jgi:hypothetical protein
VSFIALNTMFINLILMRNRETLKIFQRSIERARLCAGGLVITFHSPRLILYFIKFFCYFCRVQYFGTKMCKVNLTYFLASYFGDAIFVYKGQN